MLKVDCMHAYMLSICSMLCIHVCIICMYVRVSPHVLIGAGAHIDSGNSRVEAHR